MRHIVTFSGGKDSVAVVIWAYNNLSQFEIVFCDTSWEHLETYKHIEEIKRVIKVPFHTLKSDKYSGLVDLFISKGRAASPKSRFCTEELKTKPMIDFILNLNEDCIVYQGVRNDESEARRNLKMNDEYFKFYLEPYGVDKKGKPKYHTYRKKDVLKHIDKYSVDVQRPIIKWNAGQVFDYIFSNGFQPNPLYKKGFSRVGCFPCIMCRHDEIRLIEMIDPNKIDEIRDLEQKMGRTFFPPNYIPARFCSKEVISKKGKRVMCPTIDDVIRYVSDDKNQLTMFQEPKDKCISVYNICEQ